MAGEKDITLFLEFFLIEIDSTAQVMERKLHDSHISSSTMVGRTYSYTELSDAWIHAVQFHLRCHGRVNHSAMQSDFVREYAV
jgi:hypothetical protein